MCMCVTAMNCNRLSQADCVFTVHICDTEFCRLRLPDSGAHVGPSGASLTGGRRALALSGERVSTRASAVGGSSGSAWSGGSSGGAAAGRTLSSRGRGEQRGVSGMPPTTGCDLRFPPAGRLASCARSPGELRTNTTRA